MDFAYWNQRFQRNAEGRKEPGWDAPMELEGKPLRHLTKSLEQFQLGDGGGPGYLIAWNRERYLQSSRELKELVDLWFREEREHSRLLGQAVKRFGGKEIDGHWSFSVFCAVRRFSGIRFELGALLLTEIVSHVYYKMLYRYGDDVALREMCRLIIRDEAGHIRFHRARLVSEARAKGTAGYGGLWEAGFRLRGLLAATMLWINHRRAVVALGGSTMGYYRGVWRGMRWLVDGVRRDLKAAVATAGKRTASRSLVTLTDSA